MNHLSEAWLSVSLVLLTSTCFFAQGKRWHVDSTAVSSNNPDGSTWQRAFSDLQQALQIAKAGDSVWVAKGTYYPTKGLDQNTSFKISNGVILMGGFKGVENHTRQRTWQSNPSVLSGNIGNKDTNTDNSYHVLELVNIDSTCLIDGFWIERGASNIPGNNLSQRGGGIMIMANSSLAITNPRIANCVFQYNNATRGGAICLVAGTRIGSVKMENCTFYKNNAFIGGAIFFESRDENGRWEFNNCTFKANQATEQSPCIHSALNGSLYLRNSVFEDNESKRLSGGIVIAGDLDAEDCIFSNNKGISESLIRLNASFRNYPAKTKIWIKRTSFVSNTFSSGTGLVSYGSRVAGEIVDLILQECRFKNNENKLQISLINMINGGKSNKLVFQIDRCIFEENRSSSQPLVSNTSIINILNSGDANGTIKNCIFFKNDRPITIQYDSLGPTRIAILNSTFIDNNSGSILIREIHPPKQAQVYLQNNIFYDPATELSSILQTPQRPNLSGFTFNHNLFSTPACKTSPDTLGCGVGNIFGQSPKFVDSNSVAGLQLAPGSLAINAGAWHSELTVLDLAGQPRVQDCKVDLGAYESPSVLAAEDSLSAEAQIRSTPFNQTLGQISIQQIKGGFPPYRLLWENGDTTPTRSNLAAGSYTLTLSDQQGCFKNYSFVVPFTTSVRDRVAQGTIRLAPNPAPEGQPLQLFYEGIEPGNWDLQLLDLTGKLLRNSRITLSNQGAVPVQVDAFPKGIYLLNLYKDGRLFTHKFVIQ